MSGPKENLLGRVRPGHRHTEAMRKVIIDTFVSADAFKDKVAAIKADRNLTETGHASAIAAELIKATIPRLRAARKPLVDALSELRTLQHSVALPMAASDAADALREIELRNWLRSQSPTEFPALALAEDRVAAALLSAPRALTGIDDMMFGQIRDAYLEKHYPKERSEIGALEEITAAASAALTIAINTLVSESGLPPQQALTLVQATLAGKGAVFLKRMRVAGQEVIHAWHDPLDHVGRTATAEDLENGVEFDSADSWAAANGYSSLEEFKAAKSKVA